MISNTVLRDAGLQVMERNGMPLTKIESGSRAMLYKTPKGETVRVRTCNDHALIALAVDDKPIATCKLNIEGTDWLLVVMPEIERTAGKLITYLVPSQAAVADVRKAHGAWMAGKPETRNNLTPVLWFDGDPKIEWEGFAERWRKYRVGGETETVQVGDNAVKAEVETARERISAVAGVSRDAVKITIEFA